MVTPQQEEGADELPPSPEFGQLNVVVTPPSASSLLPTPEFGASSPSPASSTESPGKGSPPGTSQSAARKVALPGSLAQPRLAPLVASQGEEASSPNFGGGLPQSPTFGDDPGEGAEQAAATSSGRASRPSTLLEEPEAEKGAGSHPATPDFGSLQGPILDEETEDLQKLGSASSSPPGSSPDEAAGSPDPPVHRTSVDMLLPSPALEAGASTAQSNSRFNFRPAEDQAQSKEKDDDDEEVDEMEMIQQLLEREQSYRKELARRDRVLNWYHEELLSTQDELDEAQKELDEQRCEGDVQFKELLVSRRKEESFREMESKLADCEEQLESCHERLKQEIAEQSIYGVLKLKLAEAEKLQQEVNGTLRLENDDLAFDVRELRAELASAQRMVAEESASLRVSQQEAAALGDALERAEGEVLGRAASTEKDPMLAAQLQETRLELAAMTSEVTAHQAQAMPTQEGSVAAAEIAEATEALARTRADVEAAAKQEWRAVEAFDRLADVSKELDHVRSLAAAERSRHDEALAAAAADAERRVASAERQEAALAAQLQSAAAARESADSRLALAEAKIATAASVERCVEDDKQEAKLAETASARDRVATELADARNLSASLRREVREEAMAKQRADERLEQAEELGRALSSKSAAAVAAKAVAEAQLMELDEERLDLQRQLEREGRRRSSLSLRLDEAQQDAEGSGGKLAAALAARQAAESRLSAAEASLRTLEASLAHAEVAAADSGSQSVAAAGLKVRLRDATELTERLRSELSAESDGRARVEGQLQQHRESVLALQQELETQRRVAAKTEGQLTESARNASKGVEEAAELRLTLQQVESRAVTLQAAQDSLESTLATEDRRRVKEEEVTCNLKMELSGAAMAKQQLEAAQASLESTLAAESRRWSFQEELISNLKTELASASPAKLRLEVSEEAEEELSTEFAAALAAARDLEEQQKSEIAELHSELLAALQQRRAALQASERAQAARLREKEQAVFVQVQALKLRAQSELRGEVLSATVESELEERGALVREQHAELFLEIRALHGMVAQRDGELSESQKEFAEMKKELASFQSEARSAEKTAASERECCEMLLHQLEEITLQSISVPRAEPPEVQRLRDELSSLQVRHLQSEAASVKHELEDVRGTTRALASLLGVTTAGPLLFGGAPEIPSPSRRRRAASGPTISASVCGSMSQVDSPTSAWRSQTASRSDHCPLPWGPPPTVIKDLPFSSSNSPTSGSWRQDRPRAFGSMV